MGVARSGGKITQYLTVMDLAPTFLEIAGSALDLQKPSHDKGATP